MEFFDNEATDGTDRCWMIGESRSERERNQYPSKVFAKGIHRDEVTVEIANQVAVIAVTKTATLTADNRTALRSSLPWLAGN